MPGDNQCELCGALALYENFPYQAGRRLHRGSLCIKCARTAPNDERELLTEQEAIDALIEVFGEDSTEAKMLRDMKNEDFGTVDRHPYI